MSTPTAFAIETDDLSGPEIAAFLEDHVAQLRELSPPGSSHALDLDALRVPEVSFWRVSEGGSLVGCGALKDLGQGLAELKSMRTSPTRVRSGVASALLTHILGEAEQRGFERVSLETGSFGFFAPARALYTRFGFEYCAPFASYTEDPHSVFMTLELPRG